MKEKEKSVKAYSFKCNICNYEWLSKTDDYQCLECKSTYLDYQKLR